MNNGDCTIHICVRMAVCITWLAMSCPASMANSHISLYKVTSLFIQSHFCLCISLVILCFWNNLSCNFFSQVNQLTLSLLNNNFVTRINCNTSRIISAIFQLLQRLNQHRRSIFISDISYYSTHNLIEETVKKNFSSEKFFRFLPPPLIVVYKKTRAVAQCFFINQPPLIKKNCEQYTAIF